MNAEYQQYIDNLKNVKNTCKKTTLKMQSVFNELIRVRGYYDDVFLGKRPHWWLITHDGEIIDPTAKQFAPYGDYLTFDETSPEPTGKCLNCGEYTFGYNIFCCDYCAKENEEIHNGNLRI